eukprot:scaffold238256_cov19-Prasinocladus_malaysianus.AAC.1
MRDDRRTVRGTASHSCIGGSPSQALSTSPAAVIPPIDRACSKGLIEPSAAVRHIHIRHSKVFAYEEESPPEEEEEKPTEKPDAGGETVAGGTDDKKGQ